MSSKADSLGKDLTQQTQKSRELEHVLAMKNSQIEQQDVYLESQEKKILYLEKNCEDL